MRKIIFTIAGLSYAVAPALAQERSFKIIKQVAVPSDKSVRLAVLGRVTSGCLNAPIKINVVRKPLNGSVKAAKFKLMRGAVPKCPDLEPESAVFFYTPNAGFKGKDEVAIMAEHDGQQNGELYQINVQ